MDFHEFGTILFVERYEMCVDFYRNILQLETKNEKEDLVSFSVSGGYLMVEKGGFGSKIEKNRKQNPVVLRFDVTSLEETVNTLMERGATFIKQHVEFDWGTIAVLVDPDGNRVELGEIKGA